jgi:transcriptional regulator with XRE-family HTH domain
MMDVQRAALPRTLFGMSGEFEENVKKDFGRLLKAAREAAGFKTAADFASILKVEPARYRYWERGQAMPDIGTFARICNQLEVDPNSLLPRAVRLRPSPKRPDKHLKIVT